MPTALSLPSCTSLDLYEPSFAIMICLAWTPTLSHFLGRFGMKDCQACLPFMNALVLLYGCHNDICIKVKTLNFFFRFV